MTSARSNTPPIARLRTDLDGRVTTPGDGGYDEARAVFYGDIDRRPAAIVRASEAAEVARVVALARETGLELAIRSGGHSAAGHGVCDGGIVLDLADTRPPDIDAERRIAWTRPGLTAGAYTAAVGAHGFATGFGDTGSVGIGGLTLGGGLGFLSRKYGLTIDNLLAAEIITADGRLLRIDAHSHPDLFWAIRGGGGNFGIATRLKFRLHEVGTVVGGMLMLPATSEVIHAFVSEAEAAPDELSTIANIMPAPPMPFIPAELHGRLVVMALMCHAGPVDTGERVLAPFRRLATPLVDALRPMPYPELFPPEEAGYRPTAIGRTMFVDTIDRDAADTIMDHLQASDAAMRAVQIRVLGGAVARVPAQASAFAHRGSRIMVNVAAFYDGPEDRAGRESWVTGLIAALRRQDTGAYVNFLGDEGPERVRDAYPGPTWERLTAIKHRYDPDNLFRTNHNIPPVAAKA
ncbi:FAD-binding oxidoreductase [Allosalinactinospora lopnorensis]|uniref:FAD-binding oxidoreductase n=1 Tax=Allosalinactinospora lopnorensis TaxID=1352348 RepID=UPI000623CFB5|nr:FAD-binding oxidoreductase [Allosalinactinospora lopnorensis]